MKNSLVMAVVENFSMLTPLEIGLFASMLAESKPETAKCFVESLKESLTDLYGDKYVTTNNRRNP